MMRAIGGIEQSFGSRCHIAFTVKQQVTNLLPQFGATWLKRANHSFAGSPQMLFEQIGLG
jgi:hypothetical protein